MGVIQRIVDLIGGVVDVAKGIKSLFGGDSSGGSAGGSGSGGNSSGNSGSLKHSNEGSGTYNDYSTTVNGNVKDFQNGGARVGNNSAMNMGDGQIIHANRSELNDVKTGERSDNKSLQEESSDEKVDGSEPLSIRDQNESSDKMTSDVDIGEDSTNEIDGVQIDGEVEQSSMGDNTELKSSELTALNEGGSESSSNSRQNATVIGSESEDDERDITLEDEESKSRFDLTNEKDQGPVVDGERSRFDLPNESEDVQKSKNSGIAENDQQSVENSNVATQSIDSYQSQGM